MDDQSEYYNEVDPIANELERIHKWNSLAATVTKKFIPASEENSSAMANCYMVLLEEITDLHHKKSKDSMRIYLGVTANLYSGQEINYFGRSLSPNIVELVKTSSSVYRTDGSGVAIYFHSKAGAADQIRMRLEFEVLESENHAEGVEVIGNMVYLGYVDIDPFKGIKSKQKFPLFSPKQSSNI